jgi:hypothetical protein
LGDLLLLRLEEDDDWGCFSTVSVVVFLQDDDLLEDAGVLGNSLSFLGEVLVLFIGVEMVGLEADVSDETDLDLRLDFLDVDGAFLDVEGAAFSSCSDFVGVSGVKAGRRFFPFFSLDATIVHYYVDIVR